MTANVRDNAGHSDIVTIPEAAVRLGKSERTIRRMLSAGKLNAVEIGGKACVQLAGIDTTSDMF
jgi:excisionase family DNA binding protein